jgi:hypothetical protein
MNFGRGRRLRRWPGRIWRFAGGHLLGVLLGAVLVAVAGVALLVAVRSAPDAGIAEAGEIALLLALLSGPGFGVQHGVRAMRRRARSGRADASLKPANPPIEEIAADLRRMLWRHDTFARSNDIQRPAGRLRARESAAWASAASTRRSTRQQEDDRRDVHLVRCHARGHRMPYSTRVRSPR